MRNDNIMPTKNWLASRGERERERKRGGDKWWKSTLFHLFPLLSSALSSCPNLSLIHHSNRPLGFDRWRVWATFLKRLLFCESVAGGGGEEWKMWWHFLRLDDIFVCVRVCVDKGFWFAGKTFVRVHTPINRWTLAQKLLLWRNFTCSRIGG